jgi:hypothetical protein
MRFRLRTVLILLAGWLLVCGILALVSADFGTGFRDGFFGQMNKDFNDVRSVFKSPLLKWLFVLVSVYLLSFAPLMWLNSKGVVSTTIFVRLYLPIWLTIGIVGLLLDWFRGHPQQED